MEKHNNYKINFLDRKDYDFRGIGLTSCIIISEALKRGIKANVLLSKYVQLKYKDKIALFYGADNTSLPAITKKILCSKTDTKLFLKKRGLSVPEGKIFESSKIDAINNYAKATDSKIVLKPDNTDFGNGVHCKIWKRDIKDVACNLGKKYKRIIVERYYEGNEYRVFITKDGYCAVTMRRPASVLGDGKTNINELIIKKNIDRKDKGDKLSLNPWYKIKIDEDTITNLKKQKLTLESIPKNNERIFLRHNSNMCSGGDSIAFTEDAHPSAKLIAMKVLEAIPGLTYAGIDIITKDITKDIIKNYKIIEVNNMPGIALHHYPYIGKPRNAAASLIDLVFPETKSS